jgi:hypothetical protein
MSLFQLRNEQFDRGRKPSPCPLPCACAQRRGENIWGRYYRYVAPTGLRSAALRAGNGNWPASEYVRGKREEVRAKDEWQIQSLLTSAPTNGDGIRIRIKNRIRRERKGGILLEGGAKVRQVDCARAHGMWTYESRQGRNAATAVCSASAVVTLAHFNSEFEVRSAECRLKPHRLRCKMHSLPCAAK